MTTEFGLLIMGAYLLGSVPTAYLVAKWARGIDIRQYGSGNVGASNVLTIISKWRAVPVVIFDLFKGMAAVFVARLIGLEVYQQVAVGIAAIMGHSWPVFLRFNGGRGLLTLIGVLLVLAPKLALVLLAIAFVFLPFKQLATGALFVVVLLPIASWFFSQPFGIEERLPFTIGSVAILLIVVIKRLTAQRPPVTVSVSRGQLLINRLLFDRDIRDRQLWIHQTPADTDFPG